jgi:hypothetical protein
MEFSQKLTEKWKPVLDHEDLPKIEDKYRRQVTAILLENQEQAIMEEQQVSSGSGLLTEVAPVSSTGSAAGGAAGLSGADTTNRQGYDPVLISLIRRSAPNLIAYDIVGVQPMSGPTGLIFFMKSNYVDHDDTGPGGEALFNEAQTSHSTQADTGSATADGVDNADTAETDPFAADYYADPAIASGRSTAGDTQQGMVTNTAEALGDGATNAFRQMSFSIEKTSVTARSRALKAEYTTELAQDLKAIHGLDAEAELANILSTEILTEINREVVRTVNGVAVDGAQTGVATQGTFDLDTDSNGRWSVEKFKGLHFAIERDANAIAINTRRGRGNIILASADVVAALSMTGQLDTGAGDSIGTGGVSSDGITGDSFVGTLNGRYKVYVDPYFAAAHEYVTIGYKGASPYDAGIFYCPYVPLQMVKAVGENSFQPKIGFKTRYGMVANPFANSTPADGLTEAGNSYYRTIKVTNLM